MADFTIRYASIDDAEILAGFNRAMAVETEDKDLPADTALSGVKNLMAHPQWGFYLVAERDGQIAGSLMITFEWSDWRNGLFWWIQSVYVDPAYRRRGLYSAMYRFVKIEASKRPDVCGFRLYVEQENVTAQQTYEYLGMARTAYFLYEEEI